MTNTPTVTVIVGAYNHERYITQALRSVIEQDAPFGIEIVVLEDCSTDNTLAEIVEVQRALDPGSSTTLTVLAAPFNLNTNRGFRSVVDRSRAEFIATLDGDDYWTDPRKLARQVELLHERPELSMCIHAADYLDETTGEVFGRSQIGPGDMTIRDLLPSNQVPACSVVVRRSAVADLPPYFDDAPYGDLLIYLEAALHGPIGVIDEVMGIYRFHQGGLWNGVESELRELRWIDLLDNVRPEIRQRCDEEIRQSKGDAYRVIAASFLEQGRRTKALQYALRATAVRDAGRTESLRLARHALPPVVGDAIGAAATSVQRFNRPAPPTHG